MALAPVYASPPAQGPPALFLYEGDIEAVEDWKFLKDRLKFLKENEVDYHAKVIELTEEIANLKKEVDRYKKYERMLKDVSCWACGGTSMNFYRRKKE